MTVSIYKNYIKMTVTLNVHLQMKLLLAGAHPHGLLEIAIVMIRGRPILLITRMIAGRIGLHSVLLLLLTKRKFKSLTR